VAQRADAHRLVGAVFFRQKRYEDALELHQNGLSGCSQKNCDPHLPLLLAAVADDLRELNRAKEGLPFAEQALRALPKTAEPQISAAVRFSAAQVLLATAKKKGDARTRAKELASSARETYQQLGRAGKNDLASVDAWLAKNRL
jgi:tetratricopeptide (TPR) repeat protein